MNYVISELKVEIGDLSLWALIDEDGHTIIQIESKTEPSKEQINTLLRLFNNKD